MLAIHVRVYQLTNFTTNYAIFVFLFAALIEVSEAFYFNGHVEPVCLPSKTNYLDAIATVSGWGADKVDITNGERK